MTNSPLLQLANGVVVRSSEALISKINISLEAGDSASDWT